MPFALVGGAAALGGSVIQANAAGDAANKQAQSAAAALAYQQQTTAYNQAQQAPFIQAGVGALGEQNALINDYGALLAPYQQAINTNLPGTLTQSQLEATPGYQFTLDQGLKSVASSNSAKGLGVSGAALKGAAQYATGLANSTYNTDFNQQQQQYADLSNNYSQALASQNQNYNQVTGRATLGENASTQSGSQAQTGATNASGIATSLGNSLGASSIAQGNALAGGLTGIGNSAQAYYGNQLAQQNANSLSGLAGNSSGGEVGSFDSA